MIVLRGIFNDAPPERRSRVSNNPTLLYSYWCTCFSLVIIGFRLSGRYIRNERLFREDKIMAWSVLPLVARMACVHVVLIYGTNNVDTDGLVDAVKIRHREIGSQVVLAARIFYAMFIWMAKFTVSEFLKRLTERFWKKGYEWCLRGIRIFLIVTFIGVVIATLAECRPLSQYWQVIPDPGPHCRQGYAHLLAMGIADIITDILLVAFPIPIIIRSSMRIGRKLSLIALFSLSIILIIVTGTRMPLVIQRRGLQQFRTVFASSEILAAAVVSNAIVLGSFLRDRGIKKPRFKAPSTTDSMERRSSARRFTHQTCSSDENLARSLGFRTKPELVEQPSELVRPAPVADLGLLSSAKQPSPFSQSNWRFPDEELGILQSDDGISTTAHVIPELMPSPRTRRRVSWFDASGPLDSSTSTSSPTDSVIAHDFAPPPRRLSRASNPTIPASRAFPPPARRSSRLSTQSQEYDSGVRPSYLLQDPGGLLSEDRELVMEETQTSPTSSSLPADTPNTQQPSRPAFLQCMSTNATSDVPSLQDAGGLLSRT